MELLFIIKFDSFKEKILDGDINDTDNIDMLIKTTKQFIKTKDAFFSKYTEYGSILFKFIENVPFEYFKFIFEYYDITESDLYRNINWKGDSNIIYTDDMMKSKIRDDDYINWDDDEEIHYEFSPIDVNKHNYFKVITDKFDSFSMKKLDYLDKRFNYYDKYFIYYKRNSQSQH